MDIQLIITMIVPTLTVLAVNSEACGRSKRKDINTKDALRWLGEFKDKNRLLVISSMKQEDRHYQSQWNMLEDQVCEMGQRYMAVISLFSNDTSSSNVRTMLYKDNAGEIQEYPVPDKIVKGLIKHLHLPFEKIEMVLVGKDGGVKERYRRPISPTSLYETIDRMPLRMREAREQEASGMVC